MAWWSARQLEALEGALARGLTQWSRGWVPDAGPVRIKAMMAHEAGARGDWQPLGAGGSRAAWHSGLSVASVRRQLFGTLCASPVADAVATQACDELRLALCTALGVEPSPDLKAPTTSMTLPWSGAVMLELEAPALRLMLDAECVRALLLPSSTNPPPIVRGSPLVRLSDALATHRLSLHVHLASFELDLGSLQGLHLGDILPLPHRLDEPLAVRADDGQVLCAAYLGRRGPHKAVELAPLSSVHNSIPAHHES